LYRRENMRKISYVILGFIGIFIILVTISPMLFALLIAIGILIILFIKMPKITSIVLGLLLALIIPAVVKGYYYPTSLRAFIPNFLDSQYKEFKKFSQQELGRVLYARPLTEIEKNDLNEDSFYARTNRYGFKNKDVDMFVGIEFIYLAERLVYVYIKELGYYGGWNEWKFNLLLLPNTIQRNYNSIDSVTINNSQIIQNKEMIGSLKRDKNCENCIYIVFERLLDKPNDFIKLNKDYNYDFVFESSLDELNYLNNLEKGYRYFKTQGT
ncbi:hypothetical protein, partial [Campylobacter helveticus]|uniref:hypothetical protein n=1 Tax=Campylobacter helveticus TaxID=28898 RepID=UPI002149F6E3